MATPPLPVAEPDAGHANATPASPGIDANRDQLSTDLSECFEPTHWFESVNADVHLAMKYPARCFTPVSGVLNGLEFDGDGKRTMSLQLLINEVDPPDIVRSTQPWVKALRTREWERGVMGTFRGTADAFSKATQYSPRENVIVTCAFPPTTDNHLTAERKQLCDAIVRTVERK